MTALSDAWDSLTTDIEALTSNIGSIGLLSWQSAISSMDSSYDGWIQNNGERQAVFDPVITQYTSVATTISNAASMFNSMLKERDDAIRRIEKMNDALDVPEELQDFLDQMEIYKS